jgi:signal transduction histidine kinase
MLQDDGPDKLSQDQREALDRIQSNSASLLAYVESLLYMAELDRGLVPTTVGPVALPDALQRLGADLAPRAAEKGLGWRTEAPPNLILVTDEDKLLRLLRVFADNAVRYTAAGEVVVAARLSPDGVAIEVRDTGPGLPADVVRESEALASGRGGTDANRGLGFGLRLAGRLLRILNATITLATGTTGTTFLLRIPHLAVELPAPQRATA